VRPLRFNANWGGKWEKPVDTEVATQPLPIVAAPDPIQTPFSLRHIIDYCQTDEMAERIVRNEVARAAQWNAGNEARQRRMDEAIKRGTHTQAQWMELCRHYGYRCLKCSARQCTRDHVLPISIGGSDHITNLQPLCRVCNCGKGTMHVDHRPDRGAWSRTRWGEGDYRAD
jgi:5-methylcytosine-specific restriction endonuclease McrA